MLLLEQKPVLYHEWSGMVETHSLYRSVGKKSKTSGSRTTLVIISSSVLGELNERAVAKEEVEALNAREL